MASVLCTGSAESLIATRALLLRRSGHAVVTARSGPELLAACRTNRFDVAVVGQVISRPEKQRILALVREHCPGTKVLELFSPATGKMLPEADAWLSVPADVPGDLPEKVSALVQQSTETTP